ncbi:MAG TPA: hypothetical protein VEJ20_00680 [Candidatus Eremiobacteraceae bacterium]|nr:hypothetical protein [Candidatus Eremiobacteraceae bacterium]
MTARIAFSNGTVIAAAWVAAIGAAVVLVSCGQNGSSVAPGPGGAHQLESVKFHIVVPTAAPAIEDAHLAARYVHTLYVSSQTTQATVTVTPVGGQPYPTITFPCTSSSCTANINAPLGNDDFSVSLYAGDLIAADNLLSSGATSATIVAGTTNIVDVTFNPVVSSVALSVSPSSLPPGTAAQATVTINATDSGGATIIGPGTYINSDGDALSIDLSTTDTLLNGTQGHDTTLQSSSVGGPPASGPTQVTLDYNGDPNLAQTAIGATTTVAIVGNITGTTLQVASSPSPSPSPVGCHVTATPQPHMHFYVVPANPLGLQVVGDSIASGADGNLYSSDGGRQILQVTTAGAFPNVILIPGAGANSHVETMATGPTGSDTVWFADVALVAVGRVTTGASPAITLFNVPDIESGNSAEPSAISAGPDGNMWFDDEGSDYVGNITPLLGTITEFPYTPVADRSDQGLVLLPSGDLWFVESGPGKVGHVNINSLSTSSNNTPTFYTPPSGGSDDLRNIAADPNGNIWITEPTADKIARINATANPVTIDEFSIPTAHANPYGIAAGPNGAMWFTEQAGRKLGSIAFNAAAGSVPTEFTFPLNSPEGITTGPDCNIWITDGGATGRVGTLKF